MTRTIARRSFWARKPIGEAARAAELLYQAYRRHRFRRRSPLPPLPPDDDVHDLFGHELVFPPRRDLMQPGMQTVEGLFALGSLATALGAKTIFEIGTYRGLTAWFLARNCPGAEVHTLDIPPGAEPVWELEDSDAFRAEPAGMYYEGRPAPGTVVQHWADSALFDFSPWYGRCDLVYVDGAHSEPYVAGDSEHALKMVRDGGAVVWDDYWWQSPGTTSVLHRYHRDGLGLVWITGTRLVAHFPAGLPARRTRLS